jgi:hypothetical protein
MQKPINVIDLRSITNWEKFNTLRLLLNSENEEIEERYHITTFTNPAILENKHIPEVIIFPGHYDLYTDSLIINKKEQRKIINQSLRLLKAEMEEEGNIQKALNYIGGKVL